MLITKSDKTNSANYVREYQLNFLKVKLSPGIDFEYNFYSKQHQQNCKPCRNERLAGKFISDQNRVILVEGPEKDKDKLPDEKTILGWIGAAGNGLTAYVDNVTSKPLMEKAPEGSKIVSETTDEAIGTTTLTLAMALKVILKPTQFKNDQILINGSAFGGTRWQMIKITHRQALQAFNSRQQRYIRV
jgi:zinc protease